jgi:mannosyltransferase
MTEGRKSRLWILAAILLLAFALRLYRLGAESLWYDETVSVYLAGGSLPALVAHTAGDIHPPGYYLLLHAWIRLVGSSDFAVAFPSLFFGMLLVALAYWLGAWAFGPTSGLLAAFLVAISPYNIWYSQEVRMYTLGAGLGMGVLGAVAPLLARRTAPKAVDRRRLAVYAVCGALGLWMLYYFAFLLVAINLMVGLWWLITARRHTVWRRYVGWRWLGVWGLAQAAVLLLYAPWMPTAWRQAIQPPVPPWRSFTGLGDLLLQTWSALCLGQSVDVSRVWPVLLLFAALFGLGFLSRWLRPSLRGGWTDGGMPSWLLTGYVFIPVFLIYLVSLITPLYHVRYAFTYSTPFYIILGAGLAWLWSRWRLAGWLGLAAILVFSGTSLYAYHTDPHYASDDHRAAVRFLAERWRPGDAILVNAGYAYTALLTYWDGDPIVWHGRLVDDGSGDWAGVSTSGPVVVQTGTVDGDPSLGWGDPGSDFYAMSRAETDEALDRLFASFDRVWVYRVYDTVTDPNGYVRRWLEEHGRQFEDRGFTGESQVRVQGFLTGRDPLAEVERPTGAALADGSLRLVGTASLPPTAEVGGVLDLALVWRVASPPQGDTILFAGLFDEAGRRWAQTDERVLGSLYPTLAWPEGAIVRTPLRLAVPPGTPPGNYRLEVGWYRFLDGQPVWLPWTSGDRWILGEVEVFAPGDWSALPLPEMGYTADVMIGEDVRLLGCDAPNFDAYPGGTLELELVWQALEDGPEAGLAVLQLRDDSGQVLAEASSAPVGGALPFVQMRAGQSVRDPRPFTLAADVAPGVYSLMLGRRRADGSWLPVQRPPFPLGSTYPLVTIRVLGRPVEVTPPKAQHALEARFGEGMRLVGYDLQQETLDLALTLHWQAIAPMSTRYKVFVHLVSEAGEDDILAQADVYPHLPTTAWIPGEYLSDNVVLRLPTDLPPGSYRLLVGLYEEASDRRLPVFGPAGEALGDSLSFARIDHGE